MEEVANTPYYWNPDDNDLDEPMIHPASIPKGYKQHYDTLSKRWELTSGRAPKYIDKT